ncbi:MAG: ERG4/ERG24 family protein [Treponema sp.]|nr:ERG4/ERG24 family protein [Treponema sp.]MCL2251454.1 ERG4/ERG24 family protein [Treponema sp.]
MSFSVFGFLSPIIAYAGITLLHIILPVRKIKGYVKHEKTGEILNYRINGKLVLPVSILVWFGLGYFNIVAYDWLYQVRWESVITAIVMGLIFSFILVLKAPSTGKPFLADFWFGRIWNPQIKNGFIDAKMWLYLIGAVMLQLNALSFAAHHIQTHEIINPGFMLGVVMTAWFCWDYLIFEKIHLYTYDLFAERVGFKLGFGCLTFYPYFYAIPLWCTVNLPNPNRPLWFLILCIALFLFGWVFTRGANVQKYIFKIAPEKKFLWMKPEALTDGNRSILVSGYWGASRHINYMGEIIQAIAIAMSAGYLGVWQVWLYPIYYIGLLFSRQADDDKICKAKYGELWDTYKMKVKYRIIPFIY